MNGLYHWRRNDLVLDAVQAEAEYRDFPKVVALAAMIHRKALDPATWLALGDIGRGVLKSDLIHAIANADQVRLARAALGRSGMSSPGRLSSSD